AHSFAVVALAFSPDGRLVVTGGDKTVRFWSSDDGRLLRELPAQADEVTALAFSPDGKTLAVATRVPPPPAPPGTIPIGDPDQPSAITLWTGITDVGDATPKPMRALQGEVRALSHLTFLPDGRSLVAGSSRVPVRIWDVDTGKVKETLTFPGQHL